MYVLRTAWLVVTAAVVVGAGAVAGQALLPVLGPWAMVVQTTVSLGLMVPAGWFYEDVVAWLRGYLERRAR